MVNRPILHRPPGGGGNKRSSSSSILPLLTFLAGAGSMHIWHKSQPQNLGPTPLMTPAVDDKDDKDYLRSNKGVEVIVEVEKELDFYSIGMTTETDKVAAKSFLEACLNDDSQCARGGCQRVKCRPWGHYYQTIYQSRLGKYSKMSADPFQFLEIGFFKGFGTRTFRTFFPKGEVHSLEIACLPEGPRAEGKWPWGNFAANDKDYTMLRNTHRLHCGDANNVTFLDEVYTTHMKRPNSPPLTIVVEDGSHLAQHMVQSMFFWFPRIQPGGLLVVEDIQPIDEANWFRTRFLPKMMLDLHFCGDPQQKNDTVYFPTLQPLLASIHCEMHICIFERNEEPAMELSLELSKTPSNVWSDEMLLNSWGTPDE